MCLKSNLNEDDKGIETTIKKNKMQEEAIIEKPSITKITNFISGSSNIIIHEPQTNIQENIIIENNQEENFNNNNNEGNHINYEENKIDNNIGDEGKLINNYNEGKNELDEKQNELEEDNKNEENELRKKKNELEEEQNELEDDEIKNKKNELIEEENELEENEKKNENNDIIEKKNEFENEKIKDNNEPTIEEKKNELIEEKNKFENENITKTEKDELLPKDEFSQELFKNINLIRENPQNFIKMIEDSKKYIIKENNNIKYKSKVKVSLMTGEPAFDEAITILKETIPMKKLIYNPKLNIPLPTTLEEIKDKNYFINNIRNLTKKGIQITTFWKDNIKDPLTSFILMIVDDYKDKGGKRKDILNPKMKSIGICSTKIEHNFVCYLAFSEE